MTDDELFASERPLAEIIMLSQSSVVALALRARNEYDRAESSGEDERLIVAERAFDAAAAACYMYDECGGIEYSAYSRLMHEVCNIDSSDADDALVAAIESAL